MRRRKKKVVEEELFPKIDTSLKELEQWLENETKINVSTVERETDRGDLMVLLLSGSNLSSGTSFLIPPMVIDALKTSKWNVKNVTEVKALKEEMSVGSLIKF